VVLLSGADRRAGCSSESLSWRYAVSMRVLAVALLFATALAAQRGFGGRGGFIGHSGVRGWSGSAHRAHVGIRVPVRPSRGWMGRYSHAGRRSVYPSYGVAVGGIWGWSGGFSPFGWYGAPPWTTPAVYQPWAPYPYSGGPNITIVTVPSPTPVMQAPGATRGFNAATPGPRVEPPAEERPLTTASWAYLIAATNGSVWLASGYSISDRTLQFVTSDGREMRLPLSNVDRSATEQLNRERGVAVRLP
jgi:hypothetical protein